MSPFPAPLPESEAGRFELLLDLYAPLCVDEATGEEHRDPSCGLISHEQFMQCMNADAGAG